MKTNADLLACRHLPGDIRHYVDAVANAHRSATILFWCMTLASLILWVSLIASCERMPAYGSEIEEEQAVRAVLGEAAGEGYWGMLAVSSALRNRGTLQGVYGVTARHIDQEPAWVWDLAKKAWRESAHKDVVAGGTHWGSVHCDRKWLARMEKTMVRTARVGNHIFFKKRDSLFLRNNFHMISVVNDK